MAVKFSFIRHCILLKKAALDREKELSLLLDHQFQWQFEVVMCSRLLTAHSSSRPLKKKAVV